ncbi:MAG: ABC transporter ATP-binding protein [Burkholderiaceae bacterium]
MSALESAEASGEGASRGAQDPAREVPGRPPQTKYVSSQRAAVAIRLSQCAKVFANGTRALWPLDLAIEPGETVVLLGPSGCGKTTTLRLIAGLESCEAGGRIYFDDNDVSSLPIERRGVGMVFQHYALFPNMNVRENIGYGLRIARRTRLEIDSRVGEMAQLVRLDGLLERRIEQLSGGQKQRVALARALATAPRVLLLDEPLTALDARLRESLRADLATILAQLSITSVYVTHDQAEAMALGDRIAVMRDGRIEQLGTPREIYHRPRSAFVADFVGRVNRVPAASEGGLVRLPGGTLPDPGRRFRGKMLLFRPEDAALVEAPAPWVGRVGALSFHGERMLVTVWVGQEVAVEIEAPSRFVAEIGAPVGIALSEAFWFSDGEFTSTTA